MTLSPLLSADLTIQIHVAAALAAVVLTVLLLAGGKGTRAHRRLGWAWVAAVLLLAGSGLFIHSIRLWGPWSPIHLLSLWVAIVLTFGVRAARRHRVASHRRAMLSLVLGALLGAGAFTFLPGRLMHAVAFGQDERVEVERTVGTAPDDRLHSRPTTHPADSGRAATEAEDRDAMSASEDAESPGVYMKDPDGRWRLIHEDRGGDYHLHDLREAFAIGSQATDEAGLPLLALSKADARQLKALADAQSFDHEEGLIALAHDIALAALDTPGNAYLELRQVF